MRTLGLALLALVLIGAVAYALVELNAANAPPDVPAPVAAAPSSPSLPTPSSSTPTAPPRAPAPSLASTPTPRAATPNAAPAPRFRPAAPPASSPLEVRINGKTRREWHDYFQARRRAIEAEIERNQPVIDEANAGGEPDPRELGDAQVRVRDLKKELQHDQQQEQQIENAPSP